MTDNPLHARFQSPRCHAAAKRTGLPCKSPAVRGWQVCRMHGARGGAPCGHQNGSFRHGDYSRDAQIQAEETRQIVGASKQFVSLLGHSRKPQDEFGSALAHQICSAK